MKALLKVLIAAAGKSARMGMPKALMPLAHETALAFAIRQFSIIKDLEIFVTLPPSLLSCPMDHFSAQAVTKIANRYADQGYFGSIRSMLEQDLSKAHGIFIMPIDAPPFAQRLLLTMASIARMDMAPRIIVPAYTMQSGHPVYLSRHFFALMRQFSGTHGLRQFIAQYHYARRVIMWPDQRIVANINRIKDLEQLGDRIFAEAFLQNRSSRSE